MYNFPSKRGAITNPNKAIVSFCPFLPPKLEKQDVFRFHMKMNEFVLVHDWCEIKIPTKV